MPSRPWAGAARMSGGGWIKLEKDLLTDPRVTRILGCACALQGVTHLLGCLAHLWIIADAHIGNDDVLPMGTDEINRVLGVQGLCEVLPQDWLKVIDSTHVKLPGYQAHNGPEAKKRALSRVRASNHREKSNANALQASAQRNAYALPDKTRLDETNKTPLPPFDIASVPGLDSAAWRDWLNYRKTKKPLRPASLPKAAAGMAALGNRQRAAVDFSIAQGYQGLIEPRSPLAKVAAAPDKSPIWNEARMRANAINFRAPGSLESPDAYLTQVKLAETRQRPALPVSLSNGIQALAARLTTP